MPVVGKNAQMRPTQRDPDNTVLTTISALPAELTHGIGPVGRQPARTPPYERHKHYERHKRQRLATLPRLSATDSRGACNEMEPIGRRLRPDETHGLLAWQFRRLHETELLHPSWTWIIIRDIG